MNKTSIRRLSHDGHQISDEKGFDYIAAKPFEHLGDKDHAPLHSLSEVDNCW